MEERLRGRGRIGEKGGRRPRPPKEGNSGCASAHALSMSKEGDTRSPNLVQGQPHPIQSASGAWVRIRPPHRRIEARRVTFLFLGPISNKAARLLPST